MNKLLIILLPFIFFSQGCSERENPLLELNTLDEMRGIQSQFCDKKDNYYYLKKCEEHAKTTGYSVNELSDPLFNEKFNSLLSAHISCIRGLAGTQKSIAEFKSKPECQSYINSKQYKDKNSVALRDF